VVEKEHEDVMLVRHWTGDGAERHWTGDGAERHW
jgi:hypothetical protein